MMVWVQVIFFIVTNAPSLIKAIRDLIDLFQGDRQMAKAVLKEMREVKKITPVGASEHAKSDALKAVIDKYKDKVAP